MAFNPLGPPPTPAPGGLTPAASGLAAPQPAEQIPQGLAGSVPGAGAPYNWDANNHQNRQQMMLISGLMSQGPDGQAIAREIMANMGVDPAAYTNAWSIFPSR